MSTQPSRSMKRIIAFVAMALGLGVMLGAGGLWPFMAADPNPAQRATDLFAGIRALIAPEPVQLPVDGQLLSPVGVGHAGPPSAEALPAGDFRRGGGDEWPESRTFEVEPALPATPPARTARLLELPRIDRVERQVEVRRGDTLLSILLRAGVGTAEAHEAISTLSEYYDLRRLQPGQYLTLELERTRQSEGALRLAGLSFAVDPRRELELQRAEDGLFVARAVDHELSTLPRLVAGSIDDSLYAAASRQSVPPSILAEAIRLLSWDVDFQRDIQPGDRFELLYDELVTRDGATALAGEIHYVALHLQGQLVEAFRYQNRQGQTGFYDRDGRSLRKSLLRTPIDGARLSSRFGHRRHPILGYTRMHKGVDFAAPTGTPIYAAGDGVVTMAGRNGAYGNYVRIRHNSEYQTAYAHMSQIARGIRPGVRVRQGQVIGFVGSTGLSTGPHLHYEVLQAGRQVNPLQVSGTVAERLEGAELVAFRRQVAAVDALRRRLGEEKLVASREPR